MHYLTIVLVEPNDHVGIEDQVFELIRQYDENLETDPGNAYLGNPNGQWDWYRIGGRYNNILNGAQESSTDGFNFGKEYEDLSKNAVPAKNLLKLEHIVVPFALVTPDGVWHQRRDRWDDNPVSFVDWRRKVIQCYAIHANCIAVACDMHT